MAANSQDKPPTNDGKSTLAGTLAATPELYYDIFARVLPGSLFLVTVCLSTTSMDIWKLSFPILLVLLGAGYAIGMIATPFGQYLLHANKVNRWQTRLNKLSENGYRIFLDTLAHLLNRRLDRVLEESHDRRHWTQEDLHVLEDIMHNYLKLENPHARLLLPKMLAESMMCFNLAVLMFAAVPMSIVGAVVLAGDFRTTVLTVLCELLVATVAWRAGPYRDGRLIERMFALLDIVESAEG